MPPTRLKVIADLRDISFCRVIDPHTGADMIGVTDIAWQFAPDGGGRVVITFDANMIDFEITPPRTGTKE